MLSGLRRRLNHELWKLAPTGTNINVDSLRASGASGRKYATWRGGALLATHPGFQSMWISKREYDEVGPTIVHRKCF